MRELGNIIRLERPRSPTAAGIQQPQILPVREDRGAGLVAVGGGGEASLPHSPDRGGPTDGATATRDLASGIWSGKEENFCMLHLKIVFLGLICSVHSSSRSFTAGAICSVLLLIFLVSGCGTAPDFTPIQPANVTSLGSNTYQITVDARSPWVQTGVNVKAGQKVQFIAAGTWGESPGVNRSADGGQAGIFGSGYWGVIPRLPSAPWGALLGRVGSNIFFIGVSATLTMSQDGEIMLGINDGDNNVSDNHGYQTVKIKVLD